MALPQTQSEYSNKPPSHEHWYRRIQLDWQPLTLLCRRPLPRFVSCMYCELYVLDWICHVICSPTKIIWINALAQCLMLATTITITTTTKRTSKVDCSKAGAEYRNVGPPGGRRSRRRKLSLRAGCFLVRGEGQFMCVSLPHSMLYLHVRYMYIYIYKIKMWL